ncbi:DoxX family protein [Trinickia dinghuensis]|uniref:DoxX family protein n=1 Tax=Trinickia dinghuensis TaxID=2291023 RepID=A0A3D8K822_9BURK|nr:DoxX family protein [Trinickia dinghuensis]RDV00762.1 DoxX family protein [Trinickia dinghuensis]
MKIATNLLRRLDHVAVALQPLFALAVRFYLFRVFFLSGLTKLRSWDSTLYLFSNEYHVPVLPPAVAAVMGAGGELIFPVMLLLGWQSRFAAAGLFVVNLVAVMSYPGLEPVMIKDHVLWAVLIAFLFFHGVGRWSLQGFFQRTNVAGVQG